MARIDSFLRLVVDQGVSDLHFHAGNVPIVRHEGELLPLPFRVLSELETSRFLLEMMTEDQRAHFEQEQEVDFVYELPGVARFRANVFVQSQGYGAVFRVIRNVVPTLEELHLPAAVKKLSKLTNGLVLVTGPTGSGKSMTLAAMVDEIFEKVRGYRDADAQLRELAEGAAPSEAIARQVLGNSDLHRRAPASMPALGDLGDLPGLDDAGDPGTLLQHAPAIVARVTGKSLASSPAPVPPPFEDADDAEAGGILELLPEQESAANAPFEVGNTIAGRYRLEKKIGQGGMATVFHARDLELEEEVALKVFGVMQSSEVLVARFKQELKLSRQLQHPNIIRLYDIGIHDGHRYISMELLVGRSLKESMEQPIDLARALDYLVQACTGLQAAHDAGVIHRDVKPDNFFVTAPGVLKVMYFGIAKQFAAPGVTVMGSIAGTPLYMSPEQIGNFSTVTAATDLYALGICAYELFTGAVPFNHAELVPLLMMQLNEQPAPPSKRNPSIPAELEAVILKLLEKDPARRFASARELGAALTTIRDRYV